MRCGARCRPCDSASGLCRQVLPFAVCAGASHQTTLLLRLEEVSAPLKLAASVTYTTPVSDSWLQTRLPATHLWSAALYSDLRYLITWHLDLPLRSLAQLSRLVCRYTVFGPLVQCTQFFLPGLFSLSLSRFCSLAVWLCVSGVGVLPSR